MAEDSTSSTAEAEATEEQASAASDSRRDGEHDLSAMQRQLRKANKEAETFRLRLKEFEDRDKTELEKLTESHTAAERRAAEAEASLARYRVATAKGVPADLVDRLRGTTEDELSADADRLLELIGSRPPAVPSFDGGARTTAPAGADFNAMLRQAAGRQ